MFKKTLVDKRRNIINNANDLRVVSKKDNRVNSARHCCICGRSLTQYDAFTKRYYTQVKHYKFSLFNVFEAYLCYDIRSCRRKLKEGGSHNDKAC